uniref:hypothetical protein n=1 Tax=Flavobacterium sp. TaxID=239 RepID=UPI00404A4890
MISNHLQIKRLTGLNFGWLEIYNTFWDMQNGIIFKSVISKSKTACELSDQEIEDHFADVGKMVSIGSGAEKQISDIMLTRYACYLIAQNGDPRKETIAFAQRYFATQTRRAELIEQKLLEHERVKQEKNLKLQRKNCHKLFLSKQEVIKISH